MPVKYTPEQKATVTQGYTLGLPLLEIRAAANALPGGRFETDGQVYSVAKELRIKRPVGWREYAQRAAAATRLAAPRKAKPVGADSRLPIRLREVYQWGATLGLPLKLRGDIAAVSRAMKREEPGHPGFVLRGAPIPFRLRTPGDLYEGG